jgi:SAM-dependent methyltransferase
MTTIHHRVEADSYQQDYSGRVFTADEIAEGEHLRFIGGAWPKHGRRQLDFMITHGLKPEHTLLDIGCGCFRAGRHFVDYLEPGHYYGIDANQSLMQVGYDLELGEEQRARLPVGNLRANDRFDGDFGVPVDFALAQSVFTHVSLNHIRLCLYRTARVVRPGGSLFATFFERGGTRRSTGSLRRTNRSRSSPRRTSTGTTAPTCGGQRGSAAGRRSTSATGDTRLSRR